MFMLALAQQTSRLIALRRNQISFYLYYAPLARVIQMAHCAVSAHAAIAAVAPSSIRPSHQQQTRVLGYIPDLGCTPASIGRNVPYRLLKRDTHTDCYDARIAKTARAARGRGPPNSFFSVIWGKRESLLFSSPPTRRRSHPQT